MHNIMKFEIRVLAIKIMYFFKLDFNIINLIF